MKSGEDRAYLGLVDIDCWTSMGVIRVELVRSRIDLHSKSPESETTTVPVCLRWSREVVMVV
jgi:hypothetical protein